MTLFDLRAVSYAYPGAGDPPALAEVTLQVERGEYLALLGPNGAGKSTLLRLLAGVLSPTGGGALLDGTALARYPRREIAQRIAVLPQRLQLAFEACVEDLVALGRTPHLSLLAGLRGPARRDRAVVEAALQATDTARFRSRIVQELSGGEQQRVALALALAQEAEIMLLDEPTSHLDPFQAQAVLNLVDGVRRERGLTVVAVFHDVNLAALYGERILLLHQGRLIADGPPAAVLRPEVLDRAFGPCLRFVTHPDCGLPQTLPFGPPRAAPLGIGAAPLLDLDQQYVATGHGTNGTRQ
ncbi:MAG: ABC transporter ATP-binding protein [Chloroflexota bacterium]|nr:ABC transporter ATP-binding protein [Chloroflexota bacterium]